MKVSIIIPALNEEKTIGPLLRTITSCDFVDEIIVVNDGSVDKTSAIAKAFPIKVIDIKKSIGKGGAIKEGYTSSFGDILLFLDADLIGLKKDHLLSLITPILLEEAHMAVGTFENGRFLTTLSQKITPFLSGQRCIKRDILYNIYHCCNLINLGFGIETFITLYVKDKNYRVAQVKLPSLTHVMKEEKLGFIKGFISRLIMYIDIMKAFYKYKTLGL